MHFGSKILYVTSTGRKSDCFFECGLLTEKAVLSIYVKNLNILSLNYSAFKSSTGR